MDLSKIAKSIYENDQDWDIYDDFRQWFADENPGLQIQKFSPTSPFQDTAYIVFPTDGHPWDGTLFYFDSSNDAHVYSSSLSSMTSVF